MQESAGDWQANGLVLWNEDGVREESAGKSEETHWRDGQAHGLYPTILMWKHI